MADLAQKTNKVTIEGILSELKVREGMTKKNPRKYIAIDATIQISETEEVTVSSFATITKNDGGVNKLYERLITMPETYFSIAGVGIEKATKLLITSGSLSSGVFFTKGDGRKVDLFKVNNSFYVSHKLPVYRPHAEFQIETFVLDIMEEETREGKMTGSILLKGAVVQWGGSVDILTFKVSKPEGVAFIKGNYKPGDTVLLKGGIKIIKTESVQKVDVGFGAPIENITYHTERKLIVESGSMPITGAEAWDKGQMTIGIQEHDARMEQMKKTAMSQQSSAPAASSEKTKPTYDF